MSKYLQPKGLELMFASNNLLEPRTEIKEKDIRKSTASFPDHWFRERQNILHPFFNHVEGKGEENLIVIFNVHKKASISCKTFGHPSKLLKTRPVENYWRYTQPPFDLNINLIS